MFRTVLFCGMIVLLAGCKKQDDEVAAFKKYIGQGNVAFILKMMDVFENVIGDFTADNPYQYFLQCTIDNDLSRQAWLDSIQRFRILDSMLYKRGFLNDFFIRSDNVKFDSGVLIKTYNYFDVFLQDSVSEIDTIFVKVDFLDYSYELDSMANKGFLFEEEVYPHGINYKDYLNEKLREPKLNVNGRILSGLFEYSNDSLIKSYLNVKYDAGYVELPLFADTWLNAKPDYNNFFIRTVILIELFTY